MNIFSENDYRVILQQRIQQLKAQMKDKYNMQALANHCCIQRTYLSKVLNKHAHFNEDQLFLSLEFLNFSESEQDYLSLLHAHQKSSIPSRKKFLKQKLIHLRAKNSLTEEHLKAKKVTPQESDYTEYYLNPRLQLLHMYLTVKRYNKDKALIFKEMQMDEREYESLIEKLLKMKLIALNEKGLEVSEPHIFLTADSPLMIPYHTMVKSQALPRLQALPNKDKYCLSALFTCSTSTFNKAREQLIHVIKTIENESKNDNNPNQVFQLSIDLFPWTKS